MGFFAGSDVFGQKFRSGPNAERMEAADQRRKPGFELSCIFTMPASGIFLAALLRRQNRGERNNGRWIVAPGRRGGTVTLAFYIGFL